MLNNSIKSICMRLGDKTLDLSRPQVMAIVNVTDDSFYKESRCSADVVIATTVERAVENGASIIDIGGYSSRPMAGEVPVEEEWRRVEQGLRVARGISADVALSVDTFRAEVARRALEGFGPLIINDISAGEADAAMADVVAEYDMPYVAMHMRGTPATMQSLTEYKSGVVRGVREYFEARIVEMTAAGIDPKNIILDPGFGFAKSVEQNMELMKGLGDIAALGYPLLVGVSRKSMIYKSLNITPNDALPGSLAMAWEALVGGAKILRVHDVAATRQIVDLFNYYNKVVG
jgi:dihydropteroate synthase